MRRIIGGCLQRGSHRIPTAIRAPRSANWRGAPGRTRTGTPLARLGILSPVRLPIPPPGPGAIITAFVRISFAPSQGFPMTTQTAEMMTGAPLTVLSEEEQMFQQSVHDFAVERIRPLVHKMDHDATMDPGLIRSFFELGIMAVEVPEQFGGAGSSFFNAVLVVEELSHVDASCGVLVDVQNTLVNNAIVRWGSRDQQARYFAKLTSGTVGAYALSEGGSGSDAFALACRAEEKDDHWLL